MTTTAAVMQIGHETRGSGEPAALFLPGWCGDRTMFDEALALVAPHRLAMSVDLPDHGESAPVEGEWGAADAVDAIVGVLDEADVDTVVPVAVAHAGWFAIELRRRLGAERVPGVVLLDWMVLGPPPGFLDALAGLQQEDVWQEVRAGLFEMWTTGVDVPALHDYVASMGRYGFAHWQRAGREISSAFMAAGTPLAALEGLEAACPTLHVYAQPADDQVLAAQRDYAATHPWFEVHRLDARSHFPLFEVPNDVVAVIEDFVCRLP